MFNVGLGGEDPCKGPGCTNDPWRQTQRDRTADPNQSIETAMVSPEEAWCTSVGQIGPNKGSFPRPSGHVHSMGAPFAV